MSSDQEDRTANGRLLATMAERLKNMESRQQDDRLYNAQQFDVLKQLNREMALQMAQIATSQAACSSRQDTRWSEHEREHDGLATRRNIGDGVAGFVGLLGGLLSGFFGPNS